MITRRVQLPAYRRVGVDNRCYEQSFHQNGFPATQVFERAGPIADPMYHNSGMLPLSSYMHILTQLLAFAFIRR